MVHLRFAAANRDPDHFPENPAKLDLTPQERANAFGLQPRAAHFCLGSPYARLELNTAFRTLVQAFDEIHLDARTRRRLAACAGFVPPHS